MNVPGLERIHQLASNQSVVAIIKGDDIPDEVGLSPKEQSFAKQRFNDDEEYVFINSYDKFTYLVRLKENKEQFRIREDLRKMAYKMKGLILSNRHIELVVASFDTYKEAVTDFAEAFILSVYSFDKYKNNQEEGSKNFRNPPKLLLYGDFDQIEDNWLRVMTSAAYWTRDMINEPVSYLNTQTFSREIRKLGDSSGFSVDILDGKQIEALKMGGLLAVNRGSVDPPRFCILEYKPGNSVNDTPLVMVGKGIVYDTGGLNIKTGGHMADMKGDMAGAAVVAGVMSVISNFGLPFHVVGLIPLTDNRPGGNAYTQGDIITMFNKTTVEIGNTDAEGRLILADAISYATKYKPFLLVNIATLTGSASVSFGNMAIAMMSNADRKEIHLLEQCGEEVFERVAELPFWEEYGELLKSEVADISNIGKGRGAGTITAGKFLEKFADSPFIHLDIAGTGIINKDDYYRLKEFPGSGLRLLATFCRQLSKNRQ